MTPDLFAPVLDEFGVLSVLRLEVGETAPEDEDLVGNVLAVSLELISRFGVNLDRLSVMQSTNITRK